MKAITMKNDEPLLSIIKKFCDEWVNDQEFQITAFIKALVDDGFLKGRAYEEYLESGIVNADARTNYLKSCIAIARTHLEAFPDQNDHDVRYALEALDIDDPDWKDRIYDPEVVGDQRATIETLYADIKTKDDWIASLVKRFESLGYDPEITSNGIPVRKKSGDDDDIVKDLLFIIKGNPEEENGTMRSAIAEIESLRAEKAKLESDMVACSCEKWKSCVRHAGGKCRICNGEDYYIERT